MSIRGSDRGRGRSSGSDGEGSEGEGGRNSRDRDRGGRGSARDDRDPDRDRDRDRSSRNDDIPGFAAEMPVLDADVLNDDKMREMRRARTMVEVRFQEHALCTSSVGGAAPLWKQSMSIPFQPPQNDFTPINLSQVRDEIVFTLFDEIIADDVDVKGALILSRVYFDIFSLICSFNKFRVVYCTRFLGG